MNPSPYPFSQWEKARLRVKSYDWNQLLVAIYYRAPVTFGAFRIPPRTITETIKQKANDGNGSIDRSHWKTRRDIRCGEPTQHRMGHLGATR